MSLSPPVMTGGIQLPTITAVSEDSLGTAMDGIGAPTSKAWTAVNVAIFIPFTIQQVCVAYKMWYASGAIVDAAGHQDLGIYNEAGSLIVSSGSISQGTLSLTHMVDIADTTLVPGRYWMAMSCDSVTSQYRQWSGSVRACPIYPIWKMDTAFPLPSTATFASMTTATWPDIGVSLRTQDNA